MEIFIAWNVWKIGSKMEKVNVSNVIQSVLPAIWLLKIVLSATLLIFLSKSQTLGFQSALKMFSVDMIVWDVLVVSSTTLI